MLKYILPALQLFALVTPHSFASDSTTTLSTGDLSNPLGNERGSWHYQSATLTDPGFIRTGKLTHTMTLKSVSFLRYKNLSESQKSSEGPIILAVLSDPSDLGSKVAESQNSIDVDNTSPGKIMTWIFKANPIKSNKEYYYAFYRDSNGNKKIDLSDPPAVARIANLSEGSRLTGNLRSAPSGGITSTDDAYISISATSGSQPIPATKPATLLQIGDFSMILQTKK